MEVFLLLALFFNVASASEVTGPIEVCVSRDCIITAYHLLKNMNTTADPCEDFYEFSCGGFNTDTRIPDDKGRWAGYDVIEEEINYQGRTLLEEKPREDDFDSYQLARNFYKSCSNTEKLEQLGVETVLNKLKDLGGWPVLDGDKWGSEETFKWWEWNYKVNKVGFNTNYLVSLAIDADDKNASWNVIHLDQASLGLSREYLIKGFKDKDVQHYYKYMVDVAILLGAESEVAKSELEESLKFEISLAHIATPKEERRNATALYNPTTLGDIKTYDHLPSSWTKYIKKMFEIAEGVKIDDSEKVILNNVGYFKKLSELLKNTRPRVLANYLAWRIAKSAVPYMTAEALRIQQVYNKAINGDKAQAPDWKRCTNAVGFSARDSTTNLGLVAGSMYVRRYFNPEAKQAMIEMATYIKKAFEEDILENLDWMDDTTKEKAKEKLTLMEQFIAYEDAFTDKDTVDGFFANLNITEDEYFENSLKIDYFWKAFKYNQLRVMVDPKSWLEHGDVTVVNAFYSGTANYMEFPAGILQGVFYNPKIPNYMNYGGIGAVIGHEITHGFDDRGRQRNGKGEIEDWWEPITNKNFKERAQCVIDLYGNYTDKQVSLPVNGIANQGENIADIGGLKEAYLAYLRWLKDNKEEPMITGLPYTPKQMFWISFAQTWCTKYQDESIKKQILTGNHSPAHFRVKGSVSNIQSFADDFECPVGTYMNPEKKCSVW